MNNQSKQQSIQQRREVFVLNQRSIFSKDLESRRRAESARNTLQTQQRAGMHQLRVNDLANQISPTLENAHIEFNQSYDLLTQLQSQLNMEETLYINLQPLQAQLLLFRDTVVDIYENQKSVQFLLLAHYADHIITFTARKHLPKYRPEDILLVLNQQQEPKSRDFLIQNARNSELWTQAVVFQGLELSDMELMEILVRMLDQPYTWKVFIASKKVPFNQEICLQAWNRKKFPEVGSFIIQQVMKGGDYFNQFCQYGIYEAFKVFISETTLEFDQQIKIQRVLVILEGLSSLWADSEMLGDTKQILESRIFEYIVAIPLELFNKEALYLVLGFINKIEHNPNYDLSYITLSQFWYYGLYKILLLQRINGFMTERVLEKIDILFRERLSYSASEKFKATINECQQEIEKRRVPQILLKRIK